MRLDAAQEVTASDDGKTTVTGLWIHAEALQSLDSIRALKEVILQHQVHQCTLLTA